MIANPKIALSTPGSISGPYFSLHLKPAMRNEIAEYDQPDKLFVVADIEGNFQAFSKILIKNGIIDKYYKWVFGDGHLVIVGDCFDRGEQVIECLWLIYSLEEKAKMKGGYVHFILGNHEIMNMNGDWRYVHPKYAEKRPNSKNPATALYYGNSELWYWLCTKNIVERIGNTLFVHGGISLELLKLNLTTAEINNISRPYYTRANEQFTDPALSIIFNSDNSPFWYRGYYQQPIKESQIDEILAHFKVQTIVTGHTMVAQVTSFFNGKVIDVDTDHAAGISEGLLIRNNRYYRIKNGQRERIK